MAKNPDDLDKVIFVCTAKDCRQAGSKEIYKELKSTLKDAKALRTMRVIRTRCTSNCKRAPAIAVMPDNRWILGRSPDASVAQVLELIGLTRQNEDKRSDD